MMLLAAIAMQGFAAYGAPTSEDALEAFVTPILAKVRYYGDALDEPRIRALPDFPFDISLERCLPRAARKVRLDNGQYVSYRGYECVFEVWPNAEPSYRNSGFFRHNGLTWEYYGPRRTPDLPTPAEFDPIKGDGRLLTKDGSLAYEGDPENPLNEGYDPYAAFFEYSDALDASGY